MMKCLRGLRHLDEVYNPYNLININQNNERPIFRYVKVCEDHCLKKNFRD